jgi:hypothetical protein
MKNHLLVSITLIGCIVLFTGFKISSDDHPLEGEWIRTTDNLRIRVTAVDDKMFISYIIKEGKDEFPCEVSAFPIYRNIVAINNKRWKCDFLVVTMGSCATDYEEGSVQINKTGELEINCPGFGKKIYRKLRPRYEN